MAYSSLSQVQIAAGGEQNLIKLTDQDDDDTVDLTVLAQAQAEADGWINSIARRLHGLRLPFNPVPPEIQTLAAAEAVYRLKGYRNVTGEEDARLHGERERWLNELSTGQVIPGDDVYPIGDGGGTPSVDDRDSSEDISRESMKGFA